MLTGPELTHRFHREAGHFLEQNFERSLHLSHTLETTRFKCVDVRIHSDQDRVQ
jgi:hypothetical protein